MCSGAFVCNKASTQSHPNHNYHFKFNSCKNAVWPERIDRGQILKFECVYEEFKCKCSLPNAVRQWSVLLSKCLLRSCISVNIHCHTMREERKAAGWKKNAQCFVTLFSSMLETSSVTSILKPSYKLVAINSKKTAAHYEKNVTFGISVLT